MSKRAPCSPTGNWYSGQVGECGQHLVTGESPVVSGVVITHRGGAYLSVPTVIFSGGGNGATGAFGEALLSCSGSGVVTGVRIVLSGWHYTESPTIIFSGKFAPAAAQSSGCMQGTSPCDTDTVWNHPTCMCSGSGLILGYQIFANVTLIPPQCSNLYVTDNWQSRVNATGGSLLLPTCGTGCLNERETTNYGECQVRGSDCDCKTTFQSGWNGDDCSEGLWQKTANYCFEKGSKVNTPRCAGPWTDCTKPIDNQWSGTNQFLDFGVCTKRGFKNVVGYKSWHGEIPFDSLDGCGCLDCATCSGGKAGCHVCSDCFLNSDNTVSCHNCSACDAAGDTGIIPSECSGCTTCGQCPYGEQPYSVKYLDSIFTFSNTYRATNPPQGTDVSVNASASLSSSVNRLSSKLSTSESYNVSAHNWNLDVAGFPIMGPLFIDRCSRTTAGYPTSGFNGYPWNYTLFQDFPEVDGYDYFNVATAGSFTSTTASFHQVVTHIFVLNGGANHDLHEVTTIDAVTALSNPYTIAQLNKDVDDLLNQWNLTDDLIYPWRTDSNEVYMPKMSYCEGPPTSPLNFGITLGSNCPDQPFCRYSESCDGCGISWTSCTGRPQCVTPGSGQILINCVFNTTCSFATGGCVQNCNYDGRMLGGPAAVGHISSIDFLRVNNEKLPCNCEGEDDSANQTFATKSYGAVVGLPHATQVTNDREQMILYGGAYAGHNDPTRLFTTCAGNDIHVLGSDILSKIKYAEVIQQDKPSADTRLPCGIGSSKDLTYINVIDNAIVDFSTLGTGCFYPCDCVPCGTGTAQSCTNGTLPFHWQKYSGIGFVCNTAMSITSGKIETGKIDIYTISGHSGVKGQYVNAHLTFGSGNFLDDVFAIAAVLNTSGFTITGNFTSYLGQDSGFGGWIDFATGNDWFDNYPKGDFTVRSWTWHPFTGNGFNSRAETYLNTISNDAYCLPWRPCEPAIVVIGPSGSPESSTARNVKFIQMPSLTPHPCGAKIHYIPQQWKTDPLWIRPSKPCCLVSGSDNPDCQVDDGGDDFTPTRIIHRWEEDDGSCRDLETEYKFGLDGGVTIIYHHHYPLRPFVESYQTRPVGSPALPTDACSFFTTVQLANAQSGCLSIAQLEALTTGNIGALRAMDWGFMTCLCDSPVPGSYWGGYAPWRISPNQEACIRAADQTGVS
jgi:hypothetical protein